MPLYEYLCRDCDQQVELLVRSDREQLACPECGGAKLMKLLSVPAGHSANSGANPGTETTGEGPCGSACGCFPPG